MKIHTIRSLVLRQLREVHQGSPVSPLLRRVFGRLKAWSAALEEGLAAYYRVCTLTPVSHRERRVSASAPEKTKNSAVRRWAGTGPALMGVGIFSLSMPAMKMALQDLHPDLVGLGRFALGALPAAVVLGLRRERLPSRRQFLALAWVAALLGFGFSWPLVTALAQSTATHAAIVAGLIPLVVALTAVLRAGERPPRVFWVAAALGTATVVAYGISRTHDGAGTVLLGVAAVCGGIAYAEGGRLSRELGTVSVTCWIPVISLPWSAAICLLRWPDAAVEVTPAAWAGLWYNGLFSCWLGFLFWNRGLAQGGIARIGQLQLMQPFLTLIAAGIVLHEPLGPAVWAAALGVMISVALAQAVSAPMRSGVCPGGNFPPICSR